MKKLVVFIFYLSITSILLKAQVPQSFNYQAVVRDANGNIIQNQQVHFRFSIIQDNANGTVVYQETQLTTTNNLGLVTLAIGQGTPTQGNFSSINWANAPHFLKVEVDVTGGTNFVNMGTTQLLSVPYALFAQKSITDTIWIKAGNNIYNSNSGRVGIGITNPTGKVTIQGDTSNVLFEVKDKDGNPVFVVYQDSVHVFVSNFSAKANKGCFAVNPKAQTKAGQTNYLRITPDSSRVYTENPTAGFGVRDLSSGTHTSYMQLTPENYFIGHNAGENLTNGSYNLLLGYQAGKNLHTANSNICLGYKSGFLGYNNMNNNILLGNYAGYNNNASKNIFIGDSAGYRNIRGYNNIYIGNSAGYSSLGYDSLPYLFYHSNNVLIGNNAGKSLTTISGNTIIGSGACENSTNSTNSTIIGTNAVQDGNLKNSTVIGLYAGANASGEDNIYIGNNCGRLNIGSNNIFIGNFLFSYASNNLNNKFIVKQSFNNFPLLFGDFNQNYLVVNGDSSVFGNISNFKFFVNGQAGGISSWINLSDKKFKTNIQPISDPLEKIMQLNGVSFNWTNKSWGEKTQIGFIAQDVEKVLPEVVVKNGNNYGMQYAPITALLVEGIKAQQKKIEELEKEIKQLKELLKK